MTDKPTIEDCMEQAQIFASTWNLVGSGVFGATMKQATAEKEALEAMLRAALAAPAQAVPASGPVGFDHKTAANFLNGKTVADEEVRLFVAHSRWAHDDRDWLRNTIADLRREIAQREAEIALLKTSLLDAEALQPAAQAQLEAVGAGGVGPLVGATQRLDRETSQFLSDVMTAAGLVEHGKQCKALAERVANGCRTLRTALAAAAPAPPIMCKPPKSWNKRGQDAYRRGWEDRGNSMIDPTQRYLEGCRDGYAQRDAEVRGALA